MNPAPFARTSISNFALGSLSGKQVTHRPVYSGKSTNVTQSLFWWLPIDCSRPFRSTFGRGGCVLNHRKHITIHYQSTFLFYLTPKLDARALKHSTTQDERNNRHEFYQYS